MACLPTPEQLRELPSKTLVAFAARCARRVLPFVLNSHLELTHKAAVERAIQVVEEFAGSDGIVPGAVRAAAAGAIEAVVAARASVSCRGSAASEADFFESFGAPAKPGDANIISANAAVDAARAAIACAYADAAWSAAAAALAVSTDAEAATASARAMKAADTAVSAAGSAASAASVVFVALMADASAAITKDYNLILEEATRGRWTDETVVPPAVFGELWPEGEPDWARLTLAISGDHSDTGNPQGS